MKKKQHIGRRQPPGPDYQFRLDDLARMAYQFGGRLQIQIYPKELDEAAQTADAVDPQATSTGKPTTRV